LVQYIYKCLRRYRNVGEYDGRERKGREYRRRSWKRMEVSRKREIIPSISIYTISLNRDQKEK